MTAWARVSKQMVQMFGPQWTDRFGAKNEMWEAALKDLTYQQIQAGIRKVMQGSLKVYEIDLPRFLDLCKPPPAPVRPEAMARPDWMEGMSEDEIQMNCFANMKLLVWCSRHPLYGLQGEKKLTKEQNKRLWSETRRLSRDFFMMREELGKDSVPQDDFLVALQRGWARVVEEHPND